MNVTVIQQPRFEPVSLAEVYQQLRLTPEGSPPAYVDDALLEQHIATARAEVETLARRSLVQQTLRLAMPAFPSTGSDFQRPSVVRAIRLSRPPVLRVDSVSYFDSDNQLQVIAPGAYYVTDEQVPELRFAAGFQAAALYDRPDALRVEYVAGYAPVGSPADDQAAFAANVPPELRAAVLIGVQLLYDDLLPPEREALERARVRLVAGKKIELVA